MNIEAVKRAFEENFTHRGEVGASVSIWKGDTALFELAGGFQDEEMSQPWTTDTPVLVWSATKGIASTCLLHALEACNLSLKTRVGHLWPRFAKAGKQDITIRMLLEHQAGLCALDNAPPVEDTEAVLEALENQTPAWQPGTAHGYHPRTFGFLIDGVLKKLTGSEDLAHYWRRIFGEPLNLDFWIGVPEHVLFRVASVFPPKGVMPKDDPFFTAFMTPGSLTSRSFASPKGLHSASAMNTREARMASYPGFGGIGTAGALAKFYAMLACGGSMNGRVYFKPETLALLETTHTQGMDKVLCMETAFSCGFMKDPYTRDKKTKTRQIFGPNTAAFGHPGAGGSIAFADPTKGIAVAYVMNRMASGVLPNERALRLVAACYKD